MEVQPIRVGVVVLAAGASRRMGRPKLLLPWGETTVLGHLLRQWNELGAAHIAVVCAEGDKFLAGELDRVGFAPANRIVNSAPENGMFSSIQCAARWAGWGPQLTHWVITLGDQPHLRASTLRQLIDFAARDPDRICQPMRGERRKHPVLFPKRYFFELGEARVSDLKMFLVECAGNLSGFPSEDPGLDFDMDTPADYAQVLKMAFPSGAKTGVNP